MITKCPLGHSENLSHQEVIERLSNDDFECREDNCSKNVQFPIDSRLWEKIKTSAPHVLSENTKDTRGTQEETTNNDTPQC